jgi:periplasmic divalent cation tolerance protein
MAELNDRFQIVLCTAGSGEQAVTIAKTLVERRLAACVNVVGGICSFFHWKGKIEREDEKLLVIKSAERLFPELKAAIREVHSYEVPEILAIPIRDGDDAYLAWLGESLKPGPD